MKTHTQTLTTEQLRERPETVNDTELNTKTNTLTPELVGETKWQQGMTTFCKPFTTAVVRYFDHAEAAEARKWLGEAQRGGSANG
jgi:hypothetical protein